MNNLKNIGGALPPMLTSKDLTEALSILPKYDGRIREKSEAERLIALSDLYRVYLPSPMSVEIYSKLYLALLRSLQKKIIKEAIRQKNENFKMVHRQEYSGILGGADSFTIIGTSGIGKSAAISRAISLITEGEIIEVKEPFVKIIPCIVVQCPFDSSVKGLLLEILRKVDEQLGSKYYHNALKARATTDMLIGSVSQVALSHIGLLVVDEIQNVVNSKYGKSLIGMLTQLINNSGISICMVGTHESVVFFERAMQLARRSLGLQYSRLEYDDYFYNLCCTLFSYQYTKNFSQISDGIIQWLYEHSSGIVSIVVSLIHDAQEIAILSGKEELSLETLDEAYKKRLSLLHGHLSPSIKQGKQTATRKKNSPLPVIQQKDEVMDDICSIADLVSIAKSNNRDIVDLLGEYISITEVRL